MPLTKLARLPVWAQLSIRKQFIERTENISVFFEETVKLQNNGIQLGVELRIDGPYTQTIGTRNELESTFEVNAEITAAYNEQDTMSLQSLGGIVIAALSQDFCIYKLGSKAEDTKEFFETLQLISDDRIEMSNFGQVDPTNKIYQATVEAHYKVRFEDGTI